jgi:16S rRNA processing protein RimM
VTLLRIGRVVRAVGLGGMVGVGGSEGGLGALEEVTLRREGEEGTRWRVLEARPQGRVWAVRLEGVADRDAAERLVGCEVLARREDLGEAGEGLHYWGDLEGLRVVTASGEEVGTVTALLATGGVDVLVVRGAAGEVLVPLAPYVTVEREAARVVVDPPEGLLELGAEDREAKGGRERGG